MDTRQEFEAWARTNIAYAETVLRQKDGDLLYTDAANLWECWQAATQAMKERAARVCDERSDFFIGAKHPLHVRERETADELAAAIRALE